MNHVKVALDWTPNTNHIGLFVARELGFYRNLGIDLELINPLDDNYQLTPGKRLELGSVDLAIAPLETVISLNNKPQAVDAVAVFTLLQEDLSSIVTLASSGIDRPGLLDGKRYASYKARYEDYIVQELVKNDGGSGEVQLLYPDKLGIWNTLLAGEADATWIFDNWEGVEAWANGIDLTRFRLAEYGIPYGYSPVLIARRSALDAHRALYTDVLRATREGYLHAASHPDEAAAILTPFLTDYDKTHMDLHESIRVTHSHFGDARTCGTMNPERVQAFLQWLVKKELERDAILTQTLFTNELLS